MYALTPDDVMLGGYPVYHVAGSMCFGLSVFATGASILVPTRLGMRNKEFVSTIWKQVEQYRITVFRSVPTSISAFNMVPVNADISSLRLVISGGSMLPSDLAAAFERNVGKPIRNLFGMTEVAGVVTLEPFHGERVPVSAGYPLAFTKTRAFRLVQGKVNLNSPCAPCETGMLCAQGPHVIPGYTDPKLNVGTFEAGWLISGDLGYVDEEGRVYVTGHAKDLIIRGAHNIDPQMIEDAMRQHPDVANAAAIGQPDSYSGEIPVVFVCLKPGKTADEEALRQFVAPLVAEPAARPKHVWIVPELPLTPIGKVFKPTLRAIATERAVSDALRAAGLAESAFAIEMQQFKAVIRLKRAEQDDAAARKALLGMPIEYEIQSATGAAN